MSPFAQPRYSVKGWLKKLLLFCGIFSSLYYVAINIIVPMQYPGYSIASQTVSELSAIDAPTRPLWVMLCTVYTLLLLLFGWGMWLVSGEKKSLRTAALLTIAYCVIGIAWPPMHQRHVLAAGGGTITDTMHIVFTVITVLLMMLVIGFCATAFGKRFRFYSMVTVLVMLGFGALTGYESPHLQANEPTPWIGVWERISMGAQMLWIMVLAVELLQAEKKKQTATFKLMKEKIIPQKRKVDVSRL